MGFEEEAKSHFWVSKMPNRASELTSCIEDFVMFEADVVYGVLSCLRLGLSSSDRH